MNTLNVLTVVGITPESNLHAHIILTQKCIVGFLVFDEQCVEPHDVLDVDVGQHFANLRVFGVACLYTGMDFLLPLLELGFQYT